MNICDMYIYIYQSRSLRPEIGEFAGRVGEDRVGEYRAGQIKSGQSKSRAGRGKKQGRTLCNMNN